MYKASETEFRGDDLKNQITPNNLYYWKYFIEWDF